jgi:hypothetical protein
MLPLTSKVYKVFLFIKKGHKGGYNLNGINAKLINKVALYHQFRYSVPQGSPKYKKAIWNIVNTLPIVLHFGTEHTFLQR